MTLDKSAQLARMYHSNCNAIIGGETCCQIEYVKQPRLRSSFFVLRSSFFVLRSSFFFLLSSFFFLLSSSFFLLPSSFFCKFSRVKTNSSATTTRLVSASLKVLRARSCGQETMNGLQSCTS